LQNSDLEYAVGVKTVGLASKFMAGFVAMGANFPPALAGLLGMMFLDYLSGLSAAGAQKKLNSDVAKRGLFRKVTVLMACCGGYVVSMVIPPLAIGGTTIDLNLGSAVCGAFILAEFISIMENVGMAGVKLPGRMRELLVKLKQEVGDEEDRKRVVRKKLADIEKRHLDEQA